MNDEQISSEEYVKESSTSLTIFGVRIDSKEKAELLNDIATKIEENKKFYIVTAYSEMFVKAYEDVRYAKLLKAAAFVLPDGIVINASERYFELPKVKSWIGALFQWLQVLLTILTWKRNKGIPLIKGREFFYDLMSLANTNGWTVVFLGDGKESAQKAKTKLESKYPKAVIRAFTGPMLTPDGYGANDHEKDHEEGLIQMINSVTPQLLFVGFGPPKQELWINRVLSKIQIREYGLCAVGIGGTFDYVNGTMPKPPRWMENRGLEWLWRLIKEPSRSGRIWNAVVVYSTLIIREKLNRQ